MRILSYSSLVAALALIATPLSAQSVGDEQGSLPSLDYLLPEEAPHQDAARQAQGDAARNPSEIEEATGGRLGVALVTADGRMVLGFNRDERFAMCSTFKAPLAAAILAGSAAGHFDMHAGVRFGPEDILDYAPVVKENAGKGMLPVEKLARAAVEVSDNSAANLLLPLVGGPEGLTDFVRLHGDSVTRLDRTEPTLNENAVGDPRDTTSPATMAGLMARLLFKDMKPDQASILRGWMEASTTGNRRIRAGLPEGWTAGDKTGTCGNAVNDVAVLKAPDGKDYVLAIYVDRPTVKTEEAEAAIAEVTRAALDMLDSLRPK